MPDVHEGKLPPSPSGWPRSVYRWVPAARGRVGLALSCFSQWPSRAGNLSPMSFFDILNTVE